MAKVTLCGAAGDKDLLLRKLQDLGSMHLVSLRPVAAAPEHAVSPRAEDAYKALRYLRDVKASRRQVTDLREFDFQDVVRRALANQQRKRQLEDRRDVLRAHVRALEPWGDFQLPPESDLAGYKLWFYQVPHPLRNRLDEATVPWHAVHRDNRFLYVVAVAREEPPTAMFPVARTHTGSVPLHELYRRLQLTELDLEDIAAERHALSRWIYLLSANLAQAEDTAALKHAETLTLDEDGIVAVQGWVPRRALASVQALAEQHGFALLAEPPAAQDTPPTLLENPQALGGGEELVGFFQTPAYHTWDPSRVVFFSFALFFAMILADAGYAAGLALVLAYYWRRMGKSQRGRRLRVLGALVMTCSVGYGILVGSYFGIAPPPESVAARLAILNVANVDAMMQLSIAVGCLHLMLANGFAARRAGRFPEAGVPLGWIAVIGGGLLTYLSHVALLPAAGQGTGVALIIAGVVLIIGFGNPRPLDSVKSAALRLLGGLLRLTDISKAFGDVLSYLRLFALGLASSTLALTFNQLATDVRDAVPGLGLVLAILLLFLGHAINLGLAVLGGFVHGLRLNFIEFFRWGISDEGYPFRPFAKKEIGE